MTMTNDLTVDPVLPRSMTIDAWSRLDVERRVELVEGVPVVSPFEPVSHLFAARRLSRRIEDATGLIVIAGLPVDLTVDPARPTVRIPDLAVLTDDVWGDAPTVPAASCALVVEVVSSTSVERDWVTKRAEYAAAGIPRYLIVDRFARRLVLLEGIVDGGYVDAPETAEAVTLRLGAAAIDVTLDDLLA